MPHLSSTQGTQRRRRRRWLGSSLAATLVGLAAAWSFARCAAFPDDRCLEDGIGVPSPFTDGCMLCICDASGQLHCVARSCSPDGGVMDETALDDP